MLIERHAWRVAAVYLCVGWMLTAGCGGPQNGDGYVPPEEVRSDVERDPDPDVPQPQLLELVRGNTAFSFDRRDSRNSPIGTWPLRTAGLMSGCL